MQNEMDFFRAKKISVNKETKNNTIRFVTKVLAHLVEILRINYASSRQRNTFLFRFRSKTRPHSFKILRVAVPVV